MINSIFGYKRMAKVIHYRRNCIGCNSCVEHCPEHWEMDGEDGKSVLKGSKGKNHIYVKDISEIDGVANKKAAKDCPVGIIKVEE